VCCGGVCEDAKSSSKFVNYNNNNEHMLAMLLCAQRLWLQYFHRFNASGTRRIEIPAFSFRSLNLISILIPAIFLFTLLGIYRSSSQVDSGLSSSAVYRG
jgi:hypothetical protein